MRYFTPALLFCVATLQVNAQTTKQREHAARNSNNESIKALMKMSQELFEEALEEPSKKIKKRKFEERDEILRSLDDVLYVIDPEYKKIIDRSSSKGKPHQEVSKTAKQNKNYKEHKTNKYKNNDKTSHKEQSLISDEFPRRALKALYPIVKKTGDKDLKAMLQQARELLDQSVESSGVKAEKLAAQCMTILRVVEKNINKLYPEAL